MFVSRDARVIFIHIWKTGGTSIAAALEEHLGPSDRLPAPRARRYLPWRSPKNSDIRLGKHAFAIDVRERLGGDFDRRFHSFAFVRNPWDWLVSWYRFVSYSTVNPDTGLSWRHHLHPVVAPMSFEEFVRWVTVEDGLLNAESRRHSSFAGRTPVLQRDWISDLEGKLIVDFVGKFETLEEDFARVAGTIGKSELRLPHLNKGDSGSYRQYYSPAARDAVARYFASDLETFGYSF